MAEVQAATAPRQSRVLAAFILSPLAAGLAFLSPLIVSVVFEMLSASKDAAYMLEVKTTALKTAAFVTSVCAFGATIILGLPVYCLLRRRGSISPLMSVLTGGMVAFTAASLVLIGNDWAHTSIETVSGLLAKIFVCGLLGGLVFWLCAFWRDPDLIVVSA
ncbi:hypothetical protein [Microvirga pudoricolor]|uniref:hypothetical protein n=1 Tax=Microvirga pudoricolor TaxID=2778729 RepID=UPI00195269EF|nr:hypothetical protein [Microvirga pudoricolor]MBM6595519.1 hypothetical protein [Microvirga pudoricolor]